MKTLSFLTIVIAFLLLTFTVPVHAATLNVPGTFPTIQAAINAAVNGDTVLVAPGTYLENIDFKGKAITVTSSDGPDVTVIDGQSLTSVVQFKTGEGQNSIIEGFFIMNGTGTLNGSYTIGGGIYCTGSSPTIRDNVISANKAEIGGGIGCAWGGAPTILGNTIFENAAEGKESSAGGAILCSQSINALISNNLMFSNTVTGTGSTTFGATGGAINISYASNCIVTNNVIMGNKAEYGAGVVCGGASTYAFIANNVVAMNTAEGGNWVVGSSGGGITIGSYGKSTVCGNLIYDNKAELGGGFSCHRDADATFTNNTVHGNEATSMGGGINCGLNSDLTAMNNIVWDNVAPAASGPEIRVGLNSSIRIDYSDVKGGMANVLVNPQGTLNWGVNNIDKDPMFVATVQEDFHIKYTSPCMNAGNTGSVPVDLLEDFEGDDRCCGTAVDMGCDEFHIHLYYTGDATPGGSINIKMTGVPGTSPVGLFIGFSVYDPPLKSMWGDWYVAFPWIGPIGLGSIPADGVLVLPGILPGTPPSPYTLYMQAIIGAELTNLLTINV